MARLKRREQEQSDEQYPLNYFVGWQKDDDGAGYILYTTFPQAIRLLYRRGIEFYYSEADSCMTAKVTKVPNDYGNPDNEGHIQFYQEFEVNKPIANQVRLALQKDVDLLAELDHAKNEAFEKWKTKKEDFERKEADIKRRIFNRLLKSGSTTKRGRWYHRAIWTNFFRVFSYSDFGVPFLDLDLDVMKRLIKKFKKFKTVLEGTVKLEMVEIEPELYERKVKHCLSVAEQKKVYETYAVDEAALEALLPQLPYQIIRELWVMDSPIDEDGRPIYKIHPQTHNNKNPQCRECGGKFKRNTNICVDCGLESLVENVKGFKAVKPKPKTRSRLKMAGGEELRVVTTKRKKPAKGQTRYY